MLLDKKIFDTAHRMTMKKAYGRLENKDLWINFVNLVNLITKNSQQDWQMYSLATIHDAIGVGLRKYLCGIFDVQEIYVPRFMNPILKIFLTYL